MKYPAQWNKILAEEKPQRKRIFGVKAEMVLIFPDSYETGMSNLGFQSIIKRFEETGEIWVERYFYDKNDFHTLETNRNLNEFDIIGFSVSYEPDIFKVKEIVNNLKNNPLIIVGGAATFINPLIFKNIADIVFLGEADNLVKIFIDNFSKNKDKLYSNLKKYQGFYFPEYDKAIGEINKITDINNYDVHTFYYTGSTTFSFVNLIEVGRGCTSKCKFCAVTQYHNPPRVRNIENILRIAEQYKNITQKIGMLSVNSLTRDYLKQILEQLLRNGFYTTLASLKITQLDKDIIKLIDRSRQSTITLAPESFSSYGKSVFNKKFSNSKFLEIAEKLKNTKIKKIKFYLICAYNETEEDIKLNAEILKEIQQIAMKKISISINPLIPINNDLSEISSITNSKEIKRYYNLYKKHINFCELSFQNIKNAMLHFKLLTNLINI